MALIFPRVSVVFTLSSFEYIGLFTQKMKMQLFGNFFLIACLSVR